MQAGCTTRPLLPQLSPWLLCPKVQGHQCWGHRRGLQRAWGGPAPQPRGADAPLSLQVRTADMGGYATSLDFTQAVIAALDV